MQQLFDPYLKMDLLRYPPNWLVKDNQCRDKLAQLES